MADNITLNAGSGGKATRAVDKNGVLTGSVIIDMGAGTAEAFLVAGQATMAASVPVVLASNQTSIPVTGTFFQSTQPVSLASLPALPTGANTIGAVTVGNFPSSQAVTGTFFQSTQPVSLASQPLPTGASTEATLSSLNGKVTAVNTGAVVLAAGSAAIGTVTSVPVRATYVDRSGTVATGGTSQTLTALNASRNYLFILNPKSSTESLFIDFTTTAVVGSPSIELLPGQSYERDGQVPTNLITVTAATSGHVFTAKEG